MRGLLGVLRADPDIAGPSRRRPTRSPGWPTLPELVARVRAAGLPVSLVEAGRPRRLGAATELAAYRLVQESLTNTLKHGGPAARAEVRLDWTDEELAVTVVDDGTRPAGSGGPGGAAAPGGRGGQGLVGMRERAAVVGRAGRGRPAPGRRLRGRGALPGGPAVIRVFLVDDQELVRAGFRMVLDAQPDMRVVGEAGDGGAAVAALAATADRRGADGRADAADRRGGGDRRLGTRGSAAKWSC